MRRLGLIVTASGVIIFLISLLADLIGISDDAGFQVGPRQAAGIAVGLLIFGAGAVILWRDPPS